MRQLSCTGEDDGVSNEEYLELLKQGVKIWNQWRDNNPNEVTPDLNRANLCGAKLIGVNLCGANLCKADLRETDLRDAYLIETDLRDANLCGADLRGVDLRKTNLCGVDLRQTNLCGADLSDVDLSEASLHGINLRGINLRRANLCKADLRETDLREADLSESRMLKTILSGASLFKAKLRKVDLRSIDLSGVDLSGVDLSGVDLSGVDLSGIHFCEADLSGANLCDTKLSFTDLSRATLRRVELFGLDLTGARLCGVDLSGIDLSGNNLVSADLSFADLRDVNLSGIDLSEGNLRGANLCGANLCDAKLKGVDLRDADLSRTQALRTSFEAAVLTGACLEDWNVNSSTQFDKTICTYVYLASEQQERRPREGIFKPDEFATLFQQALDTVDLIFKDGIDWRAFFQSFQEIRSQHPEQDFAIQAIEKKRDNAFVVRLEVSQKTDKALVEGQFKQLYETKLVLMEERYRAELQAKDGEIFAYREQSANLMKITEMLAARPPMSETPKYDLRGAQFGGGYVAGNVQGNQYGGIINNCGSNAADITRLLAALRDQAQTFPADQKDEANDVLDDLERDLADEQPDQGRIGRRLKKLVAIATTLTIGATAFTADLAQLADVLNCRYRR